MVVTHGCPVTIMSVHQSKLKHQNGCPKGTVAFREKIFGNTVIPRLTSDPANEFFG